MILTNEGSKLKLDCVEFENGYILLIYNINFKLRLINFTYFFRHPVHRTMSIQIINRQ